MTERIWPTMTAAIRRDARASYVAIAYVGQGSARRLPLRTGSHLVANISESAVRSGQTCPDELRILCEHGVRIYSVANLHAKIVVTRTRAFIGSANASRNSAEHLLEAVISTDNVRMIAACRRFVRSLCLEELGPEALRRLSAMYVPPKNFGGPAKSRTRRKEATGAHLGGLALAHLVVKDPPAGSDRTSGEALRAARKKMTAPRRHELGEFHWPGNAPSFHIGANVIEILKEASGKKLVSAPGRVIHRRAFRSGKASWTFIYTERPKRQRISIQRLAKRVGRGSLKSLSRSGRVSAALAEKLLAAWQHGK